MRPTPILTTLIYAVQNNQILLMKRNKEPNLGLWIGPGGKLEWNESPAECAHRELREETGLQANSMTLRGHITEWSPREDWQWMMWLYVAEDISGDLIGDEREGNVRWWPIEEALKLPMPEADKIFLPRILDPQTPFYEARMIYDEQILLMEVITT